MKKLKLVLLGIVGLWVFSSLVSGVADSQIVNNARNKSVKVMALRHYTVYMLTLSGFKEKKVYAYSMGTGFFIDNNLILTEDHVTHGAEKLLILRNGKQEFEEVFMVSSDTTKDLSLLTMSFPSEENRDVVTISPKFEVGQEVFAIGNAGGEDFEVAKAKIVGISLLTLPDESIRTMIHLDSNEKIRPGFSGGGIFDKQGRLIGMTEATNGEGYAMAIKASEILEYLKQN